MDQDLHVLIAQAAKTRKEVKDAEAVKAAAERILAKALRRDGEANRALYSEIDKRVDRGAVIAG